jgi:hypothetical protein
MKKQTIFALALLTTVVASVPAFGYTLLSPRRVWKTTPINVAVLNQGNSTINDGSGGVNAVASAINTWGVVNSSITSSPAVRGSAPATITLNNNGHICNGSCLAATLTGYYHTEGANTYIDDADVYTNTKYSYTSSGENDGCSGEYDINGIMVHEVGHVIGLGHSTVSGATMYPSVAACNIANRTLEADDLAGKNDLY